MGCKKKEEPYVSGLGFDEYVPVYNDYIERWLADKLDEAKKELVENGSGNLRRRRRRERRWLVLNEGKKVGGLFCFQGSIGKFLMISLGKMG